VKPVNAPQGWTFLEPVAQDGSSRRYSRIEKNGHAAVHMDCGYSPAAATDIADFVRIGNWLNGIGLNAPDIYEQGRDYLVIEDFGDLTFKSALAVQGADELYGLAIDVMNHMQAQKDIPVLPGYYQSNVHKGRRRIIDWYAPLVRQQENPAGLVQEYLDVWSAIEKYAAPVEDCFVHADFHLENLMFLPDRKGLHRCGIIDFQGAMSGPDVYDLGNLLEDVRIDVPMAIRSRYLAARDPAFKIRYRILTTQFHCRVLGQFIKLAVKDHKTDYLHYIPRVQTLIRRALQDPLLKPLKEFFDKSGISLHAKIDLRDVKSLVAPDAF
jgi:aminoglycoside/choline kinase family phosphotransferase